MGVIVKINCQYVSRFCQCLHPERSRVSGIFRRSCREVKLSDSCGLRVPYPRPEPPRGQRAMVERCPKCNSELKDHVIEDDYNGIDRLKVCTNCGVQYTDEQLIRIKKQETNVANAKSSKGIRKQLYEHKPEHEVVKPNKEQVEKYGESRYKHISETGEYSVREKD